MQILIVEDEPLVALVLQEVLTDEGHRAEVAGDGRSGLHRLKVGPPPDLVLLDLCLPGLSGKEVLLAMRSEPALEAVPVVLISGAVPQVDQLPPPETYQAQLAKPFEITDLLRAVFAHSAMTGGDQR